MSDTPFYTILTLVILALITLAYCAFIISGRADDAEQQAPDERAYGDMPNVPHGLTPFEAASCPGAASPHSGTGASLNHSFHDTEIAR